MNRIDVRVTSETRKQTLEVTNMTNEDFTNTIDAIIDRIEMCEKEMPDEAIISQDVEDDMAAVLTAVRHLHVQIRIEYHK